MEHVFEVTEPRVIYTPRFNVVFKNLKTNEEKALVMDGVSPK